jgi:hypothetical protein
MSWLFAAVVCATLFVSWVVLMWVLLDPVLNV